MKTKKSNLTILQERSGNAVKLITDTIQVFKRLNEQIENEKASNAAQIAALQADTASLTELSDKNARIVSNFEALLK